MPRATHIISTPLPPPDAAIPVEPVEVNGEHRWHKGVFWPVVAWIALVHVGAVAALFFFTWKALLLALFMYWLTASIGVCMGYHRYLTHNSFNTSRPVRALLGLIGGLSGQGSAITWIADHRKHHAFSDHDGDPHSPRSGGFWSHMLWLVPDYGLKHHHDIETRYASDLLRDPTMRALHSMFLPALIASGAIMLAVGWLGWDLYTGISFVMWGMFVRMAWVLHVTWFVNSATHMWGYRTYETTDNSRNLWWVGLLAYGEGWHNNHHAFQRMARHGHRWWEIDVTYWSILALEKLGLIWDVVHDVPARKKLLAAAR